VRYRVEHLTNTKKRLNLRFKSRARCHSFTAINRASDVPAADWLSQTYEKNYRSFSGVVIRFVQIGEIPVKHSISYNKNEITSLRQNQGDYDAVMNLSEHSKRELVLWINNIAQSQRSLIASNPDLTLTTDASL